MTRENFCTPSTPGQYVVHFLDDPGLVKLALSSARYATVLGAVRGSWCLQAHQGSFLVRDIVRNVDESRGAEIAGSADLDTPPQPISVFAFVFLVVVGAEFIMVSVFKRFR